MPLSEAYKFIQHSLMPLEAVV